MKLKVSQALESVRALEHLNTACLFEQGVGVAFALASKEVRRVSGAFNEEREKLAKHFAKKNESGEPMKRPVQTAHGEIEVYDCEPADQAKLEAALKAAQAEEVEINVATVAMSKLAKEKLPGFIYADLDWLILAETKAAAPAAGE